MSVNKRSLDPDQVESGLPLLFFIPGLKYRTPQ